MSPVKHGYVMPRFHEAIDLFHDYAHASGGFQVNEIVAYSQRTDTIFHRTNAVSVPKTGIGPIGNRQALTFRRKAVFGAGLPARRGIRPNAIRRMGRFDDLSFLFSIERGRFS